jgi:hypothetical protein
MLQDQRKMCSFRNIIFHSFVMDFVMVLGCNVSFILNKHFEISLFRGGTKLLMLINNKQNSGEKI